MHFAPTHDAIYNFRSIRNVQGVNGKAGPQGLPGTSGKAGSTGSMGPEGFRGADGVGPPIAKQTISGGKWPGGGCWTRDKSCSDLGIKTNLCGRCEKLCDTCGGDVGFKLINDGHGVSASFLVNGRARVMSLRVVLALYFVRVHFCVSS